MKQFCALIGKFFGIIAIVFLVLGLTMPQNFLWVLGKVHGISVLSCMLGIVMFGMGTTLNLKDFALVLKRPLDILIGCCAQYFVMPFLAYLLSVAFNLDPALTTGVVLVGTCPGGTSSNVITFMSKGDVALSVTMTSVSTVLSPILTPFITYMIIGEKINFDPVGMFWSIVQIVILPICLGLAVKSFLPKLAEAATDYLPAVSSIAISLIIAGVIGASRDLILKAPGLILLVVILHNCCGYALGFAIARFRPQLEKGCCSVHRSWYAKLRSGNRPGKSTLRCSACRNRSRRSILRMAQYFRCTFGMGLPKLPESEI